MLLRMRSQTLMVRSASSRVSNHEAIDMNLAKRKRSRTSVNHRRARLQARAHYFAAGAGQVENCTTTRNPIGICGCLSGTDSIT